MPYYVQTTELVKDKTTSVYTGIDYQGLSNLVHGSFVSAGYTVSQTHQGGAVYEKGNRVMRILFGAFVKYFKFAVQITDAGNGFLNVSVFKQTSGMSGGLIGVNQVKKEMERIAMVMRTI